MVFFAVKDRLRRAKRWLTRPSSVPELWEVARQLEEEGVTLDSLELRCTEGQGKGGTRWHSKLHSLDPATHFFLEYFGHFSDGTRYHVSALSSHIVDEGVWVNGTYSEPTPEWSSPEQEARRILHQKATGEFLSLRDKGIPVQYKKNS